MKDKVKRSRSREKTKEKHGQANKHKRNVSTERRRKYGKGKQSNKSYECERQDNAGKVKKGNKSLSNKEEKQERSDIEGTMQEETMGGSSEAWKCERDGANNDLRQEVGWLNNRDLNSNCSLSGITKLTMGKSKSGSSKKSDKRGQHSDKGTSSSDEGSLNSEGRSSKSGYGSTRSSRTTSTAAKSASFYGRDSSEESAGSTKSSSRCTNVTRRSRRKLKSGMYDRPNEDIIRKVKWAHRYLDYVYRSRNLDFKVMNFNQYIAGESKIIALVDEIQELRGRLRIMNKVAYCMDETGNWGACREYYAAVLVSIEMGEEEWDSNFRRFETMLPRRVVGGIENRKIDKTWGKSERVKKVRIPEVVFCRDYQKGRCSQEHTHKGKYKDEPGVINLEHICAKCWLKDKRKQIHPETSEACPYKMDQ